MSLPNDSGSARVPHAINATPPGVAFAALALYENVRLHNLGDPVVSATHAIIDFGQLSKGLSAATKIAIPGIELDGSVRDAVKAFKSTGQNGHLLITGYHGQKRVDEMFDEKIVRQHYDLRSDVSVHSQGLALHAGQQAEWAANKCTQLGLFEVQVHAPAFHLPRVYLTLLEALRRVLRPNGDFAPVLVLPKAFRQDITTPNLVDVVAEKAGGESHNPADYRTYCEAQAVFGEYVRISSYQEPKKDGSPGDCLTTKRLHEYMQWAKEALRG